MRFKEILNLGLAEIERKTERNKESRTERQTVTKRQRKEKKRKTWDLQKLETENGRVVS